MNKPTQKDQKIPKISKLGGGYGGLQHEQYPGEHGFKDSGKYGEVDIDHSVNYSNQSHEPNRDGYRNTSDTDQNEHKKFDDEARLRKPTTQDGPRGRSSGNLGTQGKGGSKSKD